MTSRRADEARREYRRPAEPEVVASVPDAANSISYYGGADFGFYSSQAPN